MIRLDESEREDPVWKDWRERCESRQRALNQAMAEHDFASNAPVPEISKQLYAELKADHYVARRAPFWGKCAYCESRVSSNQYGDVEHYRPKGRITHPDTNKPIRASAGTHDHPGYYWLAYDWKNLLLACELCNSPSHRSEARRRIGKWDHFPLVDETRRAQQPGDEVHEEPLLINPLVEDPSEHLDLDPLTGVLSAKSPRGQACIDMLGLNERGLPDERREAFQAAKLLFAKHVSASLDDHRVLFDQLQAEIDKVDAGASTFAMAGRSALAEGRRKTAAVSKSRLQPQAR